ncbi:MAG: two-component sensor histidine kinase, partial [Actinomycetales bacterium]
RTSILLAVLGTVVIAAANWIAHQLHPVADAQIPAIMITSTLVNFLVLAAFPPMMKSSFTILADIDIQQRLDLMQADLAVAEERLRIARDLHDLFGRTLTAVALKSDLAAELAEAEGAHKAAIESRAVHELADNALKEVRATLAGYRAPDLAAEVAGAANLLTSAGISVRVIGEPQLVPDDIAPLLALVVREAATNIVRHSTANTAMIRISVTAESTTLEMVNDGLSTRVPSADGSGLESLRSRLEDEGGTLEWGITNGQFQVIARLKIRNF